MARGRATIWLLIAGPGIVVVALAVRDLLASNDPAGAPAKSPAPPPIAAAPAAVVAPIRPGCVAPPCDDQVSDAVPSYSMSGDSLPAAAITGRVVESDGAPVPPRTVLRFWSDSRNWSTWTTKGGTFVLDVTARNADYDVDAVFPRVGIPGGRTGRIHLGVVRSGERGVILTVPVAR